MTVVEILQNEMLSQESKKARLNSMLLIEFDNKKKEKIEEIIKKVDETINNIHKGIYIIRKST